LQSRVQPEYWNVADRFKSVWESLISILLDGNTEAAFSGKLVTAVSTEIGMGFVPISIYWHAMNSDLIPGTFDFEELDYRPTPIGALSLRRRRELKLGVDVFEIKLGDEFLMSSLFTASEIALARLGLAELSEHGLDVVVGGLGLGYTAKAVLEHQKVASLLVVEALEAVIEWHAEGLVPLGPELTGDLRCRFVQGDFFALAASEAGFDPAVPARRFDAVLVDIDHSPDFLLDPQNAAFYGEQGLSQLAAHLRPGGIFALWSNDRLDDAFTARLRRIFADARAEEVTFHNPLQDKPFTQTVYLAKKQAVPRKT
jgi:spermidine synthase